MGKEVTLMCVFGTRLWFRIILAELLWDRIIVLTGRCRPSYDVGLGVTVGDT